MCNLYRVTSSLDAMRQLAGAVRNLAGNLEPVPGIYPDYPAPILRVAADGQREVAIARWGMPSPAFALEGRRADPGVTNVRNTASPHRRRWLGPGSRCLVPFNAFSEPARGADGKSRPAWFPFAEDEPWPRSLASGRPAIATLRRDHGTQGAGTIDALWLQSAALVATAPAARSAQRRPLHRG
jgi:putative SOS response-associated peptidase YedK